MNTNDIQAMIKNAIEVDAEENKTEVQRVDTFAYFGMMTNDNGLVITLDDGTQFTLTIQRR